MALEATHIRFALDIKDKYLVDDLAKYLSGTIYPDSRYITKIDRKLTHHNRLLSPEFDKDDFKKGWAVHYLCDKLLNEATEREFADLFANGESNEWGTEGWVSKTAIKGIVDIEVVKNFDIQTYLPLLDYVENPNGEDLEAVRAFNRIVQKLYTGKHEITIEDIEVMWLELGIGDDLATKTTQRSKEFMDDSSVVQRISALYKNMKSYA